MKISSYPEKFILNNRPLFIVCCLKKVLRLAPVCILSKFVFEIPIIWPKTKYSLDPIIFIDNRSCEILGCFWNYLEIFGQNRFIIISKIVGCFRNHLKHFRWFEVWSCCRSEFEWRPIQSAKLLHSSNSFRNWLKTCVKQRPNWLTDLSECLEWPFK